MADLDHQVEIHLFDGGYVGMQRVEDGRVNVSAVIAATGEAQLAPSGQIPVFTGAPIRGRRVIRIALDDRSLITKLGQGAQSFVAVYTSKGKPFHLITKVVVRMQAWFGYLTNPYA
jgi:hypothetical protein